MGESQRFLPGVLVFMDSDSCCDADERRVAIPQREFQTESTVCRPAISLRKTTSTSFI